MSTEHKITLTQPVIEMTPFGMALTLIDFLHFYKDEAADLDKTSLSIAEAFIKGRINDDRYQDFKVTFKPAKPEKGRNK